MNDRFYKQIIKQLPLGYSYLRIICNEDGVFYDCEFVEINPAFEKLTGMKTADIVGRSIVEVFPTTNPGEIDWIHFIKNIENGVTKEIEYHSEIRNKWFLIGISSQSENHFILNLTDITEKKKAENELKESLTLLSEAMHLSKIGSWKWDLDTKHIIWSDEMYKIFGIDKKSVTGRLGDAISRVVHPEDLHIFENTSLIAERKPFEYRIVLPDQSIRYILAKTGEVILDESQNPAYLIGIVQDITDQKEIQESLRKAKEEAEETNQYLIKAQKEISYQKELLETVIENIPHPFSIYDKHGSLVKINAAGRELYPDPNVTKTVTAAHNSYEYFDLDGKTIPAKDLPSRRVLRGEIVKNQVIVIKRGDYEQITEANAAPIFDEDHNLILFVSFHRVINEYVEHQRLIKAQQEQLLKTEKDKIETLEDSIRVKDEFFSLISHEFKTPIAIIDTTIQVMELVCKNELSDKARGYLAKIRRNTNRQLKLVNNLLDITRMETGHLKMNERNIDIVHLTKTITESILIFAQHKNIELSFLSTIREEIICIDDEKIERVLLNLLSNAIKFTPEGRSITVQVSLKKIEGENMICIHVKDKGIGIPEDKQNYIFEKFGQVNSSFARQAEGTGIGLHLVKRLVQLMGGEITLKSTIGAGSTFTVLLPINKTKGGLTVQAEDTNENRLEQLTAIELSDIYM